MTDEPAGSAVTSTAPPGGLMAAEIAEQPEVLGSLLARAPELASKTPDVDLPYVDLPPTDFKSLVPADNAPGSRARLFFGIDPIGAVRGAMAPWKPGEAPQIVPQEKAEPDVKLAALPPSPKAGPCRRR